MHTLLLVILVHSMHKLEYDHIPHLHVKRPPLIALRGGLSFVSFVMCSLKNIALLFLEIFLIQYFTILVEQVVSSSLSHLHNAKT